MSLPKINYAKMGNLIIHVDKVPNGLSCNCTCLNCGHSLVAKNRGKQNAHHFAHYNKKECQYAYETMVHEMAKEIFLENANIITLPRYIQYFTEIYRSIDISKIYTDFISSSVEKNLGDIIPDILLEDKNGRILLIEIKVTHKVDDNKKDKLLKKKLSCLEIDLSSLNESITKDELKYYIKYIANKKWINFYIDENDKQQILNKFIKTDKYEIIDKKAINIYPKLFCGTGQANCSQCPHSHHYECHDKVLCNYKVNKYNESGIKNLSVTQEITCKKYSKIIWYFGYVLL